MGNTFSYYLQKLTVSIKVTLVYLCDLYKKYKLSNSFFKEIILKNRLHYSSLSRHFDAKLHSQVSAFIYDYLCYNISHSM